MACVRISTSPSGQQLALALPFANPHEDKQMQLSGQPGWRRNLCQSPQLCGITRTLSFMVLPSVAYGPEG
jgi:hypothetical protein